MILSKHAIAYVVIGLFLFSFNSFSQTEQWYIPNDVNASSTEPMVFVDAADVPEGYILADQDCAQATGDFDTYCVNTDWDFTCQRRYNRCLYGLEGCSGNWYIPSVIPGGPIVFACSAPEGYELANQNCAQIVVNNDPVCINFGWDNICSRAYNCCLGINGCNNFTACNYDPTLCHDAELCVFPGCMDETACNFDSEAGCDDGSCILPQWYIPNDVNASFTEPMVFVCTGDEPEGYILADQPCAQSTADFDSYCTLTDWDFVCQDRYNRCLYGLEGCSGDWYIPSVISGGPIVFACSAPEGYEFANQNCAQQAVNGDPFCVNANWDNLCSRAYNCCLGIYGCNNLLACNYDPTLCHDAELCVFPGCMDETACNFDSEAGCDVPDSCTFPGCTDGAACNYNALAGCDNGSCILPLYYIPCAAGVGPMVLACSRPTDYVLANQECAQARVDDDPFCLNNTWDSICNSAYLCCLNSGCNDFNACNYDPGACTNDGSCIYGGCTYENAENFDPFAPCDDGSCFYLLASGCLGDLNGDFSVNTGDLSIFLAAFGTSCLIPLSE